ncbi:MAG: hypothetical protein WDA08_05615 [Weeksellaceae bacterium]
MKKICFLSMLILAGILSSCQNIVPHSAPEILTAEYEIKTYNDTERGYKIFVIVDKIPKDMQIKAIILNNKRFERFRIHPMEKNEFFIDELLLLQSRMIQNFEPPPTDSRKDGMVFENGNEEIFKEINFKLK